MIRHYIAFYDTGHDYGSVEYTSEHRNNSSKNLEDAYSTMRLKLGKKYKITKTERL